MSEEIRFRVARLEYGIDLCYVHGEAVGLPIRVADWFTRVERTDGAVDEVVLPVREIYDTGFKTLTFDSLTLAEGDVLVGRVTR